MLENNKNNKVFLFYLVFTLCLLFQTFPVRADAYFSTEVTAKERAVFAFFRAMNSVPDYDFWIGSNPNYMTLPKKRQETYLLKETLRLGRGYGLYDKEKDLLELKANVLVKYVSGVDGQAPRIVFNFFNSSESYTPTFDYPYGKHVISLIINRLASFSNLPLTQQQSDIVLTKIPYTDDDFDATLTIQVRATSGVENKRAVDSVNKWLMIGEIAYLKCDIDTRYNQVEPKLWDYVASWHEEDFRIKNMPEEEKYPHPFDLYRD